MHVRPALMLAGLALAVAPATKLRADVRVEIAPGVPVAETELQAALQVRLAAGASVVVRLRPERDGVVDVVVGDPPREHTREVAIGGLAGADAARLIALAVADLALDDLAVGPDAGSAALLHDTASAAPAAAATRVSLSVTGLASAWSTALVGGGLDVAIARGASPDTGAWLAFAEVDAATLVTGELHLTGATARLGVGWRHGELELRAGATATPVWVTTGTGDQTVLAGGNASARLRVPLGRGVRAILATGVDAFATRSDYKVSAMTTISTPWLAPFLALGIELRP